MNRVTHDLRTTHIDPLYGQRCEPEQPPGAVEQVTSWVRERVLRQPPPWQPAVTSEETPVRKPRKRKDPA